MGCGSDELSSSQLIIIKQISVPINNNNLSSNKATLGGINNQNGVTPNLNITNQRLMGALNVTPPPSVNRSGQQHHRLITALDGLSNEQAAAIENTIGDN